MLKNFIEEKKEINYKNLKPIRKTIEPKKHADRYMMHRYFTRRPFNVVQDYIRHFSKPNDIVLDPFLGSGTTVKCALENNRQGTGFKINPEFEELIKCRIYKNDDFESIRNWAENFKKKLKTINQNEKLLNFYI